MVRIVLRDQDQEKLHKTAKSWPPASTEAIAAGIGPHKGPMPCAISRIAGYHREQIVLSSPRAARLQKVSLAPDEGGYPPPDRIAVDVDPVSLL